MSVSVRPALMAGTHGQEQRRSPTVWIFRGTIARLDPEEWHRLGGAKPTMFLTLLRCGI
jgi:hypothetical protein